MGIRHFFNKRITISRLKAVSGNKKNFVSTGTIDAHIQRITDESSFEIYGVYGATHKAWCDVSEDVQVGDKVVDSDGNEYSVVAINKQDFGLSTHLEVILKEYNA